MKVTGLSMKVTSHRIILDGHSDHAFLIDGDKINEVLITVIFLSFLGKWVSLGKGIFIKIKNTVRES